MKKIITLLLIACIFITGCGKTSMKDVQQNLENAENYQANVDLRIKGTFNKKKIDYKRTKTIKKKKGRHLLSDKKRLKNNVRWRT